ncbi:MAG: LptF/LptG family permease [Lentisphaeria bacterium]|nr:LptF/LptG family permease [Lentisphaeria bacterium]
MTCSRAHDPVAGDPRPPTCAAAGRRTSTVLLRYVSGEFLLPLCCCLVGFAALFLLNSLFDDLADFLKAAPQAGGRGAWDVAWYFLLLQPAGIVHVAPMSVLLSSCFMVATMGRHQELTAIRTAGVSLTRAAAPVWVVAALLGLLCFWVSEWVAPGCTARAEELHSLWTESALYRRRRAEVAYHNGNGARDWFFEQFRAEGVHRGVFIKQFGPDGATHWELQAAEAEYRDGQWVFRDCLRLPFDPESQLPLESERRHWETFTDPGLDETPERILNHVRPVEQLTLRGIRAVLAANPDLPPASRGAFRSALWHRLSTPLACLLGALFGVSLSIARERGGAVRGFAHAVGLMMAYYVVGEFCFVLARNGHLPPFLGAGAPTLAFLAWGAAIMHRRR